VKEQLAAVLLLVLGEVSVENLHALTLDNDVRSSTGPNCRLADAGQVNFHARVAANVLRIVERAD
jgi:hypothetical protein